MALGAKLQLRQSASLVMTPQLMQSIKLLQLSHAEIEQFIDDEMERNPLIERLEASDDGERQTGDEAGPVVADDAAVGADWSAEAIADRLDTSLDNVFPDDPGVTERIGPDLAAQWKSAGTGRGGSFDDLEINDLGTAATTLRDHVAGQIGSDFADPGARLIALDLADSLDESGYLHADITEVATRLGVGVATVARVLDRCQQFDPCGLFSRNLAECLALQLKRRDRFDPAMRVLVANLPLLARRDFQTLRRLCGVDDEDLIDMLAEIRALDPKPGLAFAGGTSESIVADVMVRAAADGSWTVELNSDTLPRILVDQVYFAQVSTRTRDKAERDFLQDCLQTANWLTRSLDQRAKTILKVASEIVRQQDGFLTHGVRRLRPLNLRTVADAIGMHESTVSRVTTNKYMLTPRGVFELRYFFTASIASANGGDAHSAQAVRDRIRSLIDGERPRDVLSDDAIVDLLRQNGVDIARRTVAKYREGMNIASSVQRRREKQAMAGAAR